MSDLVERLRNDQGIGISLTLCREAADEIERLRAALKLAQNLDDPLLLEIERLRGALRQLTEMDKIEDGLLTIKEAIHYTQFIARAALATGGKDE